MENKDPLKISAVVITFIIFLTGAVLCFWLYTVVNKPAPSTNKENAKLELNNKTLSKLQVQATPTLESPAEGFGRTNPFVPYK